VKIQSLSTRNVNHINLNMIYQLTHIGYDLILGKYTEYFWNTKIFSSFWCHIFLINIININTNLNKRSDLLFSGLTNKLTMNHIY
jgi:hypothetical protein